MKFLPLIWAGLWRKPLRAVLTLLAIVTAFLLLGMMGFVDNGIRYLVGRSHEDRLMTAPAFTMPIPQSAIEEIRAMPGVKKVAPLGIVGGAFRERRENLSIQFADGTLFDLRDDLVITPAQRQELANTPNGVVITPAVARHYELKAGDTFPINSVLGVRRNGDHVWTFQVLAVVPSRDSDDEMLTIGNYSYYAEERVGDRVGFFRVWSQIADPAKASDIAREIDRRFANSPSPTRTVSERAMFASGAQSLGDIHLFINAVSAAVLFVLLLLTANTLAQAVRERMGEFAVMHALGYTRRATLVIVLGEAVMLCVVGAMVGLGLAVSLGPTLAKMADVPRPLGVQWSILAQGLAVAVVAGAVSGALPMMRLRRLSVIDVLAGR